MNSNEKIDLLYLTNQNFIDKYNQKKNLDCVSEQLKSEITFYRKRILQETKNLLRGNSININVNESFLSFSSELIKYFKFIDKKELIEKEYEGLEHKEKKHCDTNFNISDQNVIMTRKTQPTIKTIENCIPLKITSTKKQHKIKYPEKKQFNLLDPKFREKGLKKEKSKQNICLEDTKPKKEKHIKKHKKDTKNKKARKEKKQKSVNLVEDLLKK